MNIYFWMLVFGAAFLISFFLTPMVRSLAIRCGIVDRPGERRINLVPVARMGGIASATSFFILAFTFGALDKHMWGFLAGTLILLVFAIWDDLKNLPPWLQLLGQSLAAFSLIASGIGNNEISNPLGNAIRLDGWKIPFDLFGTTYHFTVWADLLTFVWVVGMVNVMNFLDGLDGLAGGVSGIAALTLFGLALAPNVAQPHIALLALALAGGAFGFLPHNFHPAKIFLGSAGSWFFGFTLATLAIISGGKMATAFLALGFPILDGIWVVVRRFATGRSPFRGDKKHLHHKLLEIGLSQSRAATLLYILCAGFGIAALFITSQMKLVAISVLVVTMAMLSLVIFLMLHKHLTIFGQNKKDQFTKDWPSAKKLSKES